MAVPQTNVTRNVATRRQLELPVHLDKGDPHHDCSHQDVGGRAPVNAPARDQKLLVDRLEQEAVEVAGTHQLGELVAVVEEEHLDQAVHGEETADEEEVLGLGPAGDRAGAGEDHAKERDQDRQPEDLDRDLDQEVAAEGQLSSQGVRPQAAEQPAVSPERIWSRRSASKRAVPAQPEPVQSPRQHHEEHGPEQLAQRDRAPAPFPSPCPGKRPPGNRPCTETAATSRSPTHGSGSRSSGSMCPEMKKFKVITMYKSDVTSRNQKPTMPTLASKKKPDQERQDQRDGEGQPASARRENRRRSRGRRRRARHRERMT